MLRRGSVLGRALVYGSGAWGSGVYRSAVPPSMPSLAVRHWAKRASRGEMSQTERLRQSGSKSMKSTTGGGVRDGKKLFKSKTSVGKGERQRGREGDKRVLEDGAVALFEVDKRKLFFGFGVVGVIQLLMLSIIGNVFFTLAKMKREMEATNALKEELTHIVALPATNERLQRAQELRKTLDVDGGVSYGFFDLVTSFSSSELISSFLPIGFGVVVFMLIRGYGLRYVRRVDLLAGGKDVRLGTYNLFGRAASETLAIKDLRPNFSKGTGNDQWLGFKGPKQRWLSYLVDQKSGTVHDRTTLLSVLSGKETGSTKYEVVARQLEELFKQ